MSEQTTIPLSKIHLDKTNPRHEALDTQADVIAYLCNNEQVEPLAKDISSHGLSPLERFGVMRIDPKDPDSDYFAAEGNRRLCALKLLADPDLAPKKVRARFEKLAAAWDPVTEVPCWVSSDEEMTAFWLRRRHLGFADGVGQKTWNAAQKERHSGGKNKLGLALFEYAETNGLVKKGDLDRKLTTASRYLSNPVFRSTIGAEISSTGDVVTDREKKDFHLLLKTFTDGLISGEVSSRAKKPDILKFDKKMQSLPGLGNKRVPASVLGTSPSKKAKALPKKPKKGLKKTKLFFNQEIESKLSNLGNWKLESLYRSLCDIPLQEHVPILSVGLWSFFETMTASMGRQEGQDFHSYLSNLIGNTSSIGKGEKKALKQAIKRIQDFGNTTKHHSKSAAFSGDQLYSDLESLSDYIVDWLNEIT